MEVLPDAIVQFMLSHVSMAQEVAICNCVSKRWKDSMPYIKSLCFSRSCFDNVTDNVNSDEVIHRMVGSTVALEELTVYCPFSSEGLYSWLVSTAPSLRKLDIRVDNIAENPASSGSHSKLECLNVARNLESLQLWGVLMYESPKWDTFHKLQSLEIVGAKVEDSAITDALKACPNLTNLVLLACERVRSLSLDLPHLKQCKIDLCGGGSGSLNVVSPKIVFLEVQGFSYIRLRDTTCLQSLKISNCYGKVHTVDFGDLPALGFLTMRGIQWRWDAISKMLACASEVKHLYMKVEFTGDFEDLEPFPEIDLVDFFNSHPKLEKFDIHGAMFAALCQKNSLRNVDMGFTIPCLKEVVVSVRSPLNAEQKMNTLESLLTYGKNLKTMVVRILQMKSSHTSADEFFDEICRFRCMNRRNRRIVRIE